MRSQYLLQTWLNKWFVRIHISPRRRNQKKDLITNPDGVQNPYENVYWHSDVMPACQETSSRQRSMMLKAVEHSWGPPTSSRMESDIVSPISFLRALHLSFVRMWIWFSGNNCWKGRQRGRNNLTPWFDDNVTFWASRKFAKTTDGFPRGHINLNIAHQSNKLVMPLERGLHLNNQRVTFHQLRRKLWKQLPPSALPC